MTIQPPSTTTLRCAIYTRKSTDDGLEQGFNSLDAQHEACAAYITSQRHEGWRLIPDRFDDGAVSGGTLDRPALQRLLREVDAGRVGMIVVYKIDRLTRSLSDFARLIDRLEAHGCSFVSVTQAFNTANAMGRLTLNVLLSFAQFEREVTAERIRDKIAASKQRGLWMGGNLPLGYDRHPDPREAVLVVNDAEAAQVQRLFDLYEQHGTLRAPAEATASEGITSKARVSQRGRQMGGRILGPSYLQYLLSNPVYLGRIRHKSRTYDGQHPAIITADQFERVQAMMLAHRARPRGKCASPAPDQLLIGKLRDDAGDLITPTHTKKGTRRYRYYVSNRLLRGIRDPRGWRLAAAPFEHGLAEIIQRHLRSLVDGHRLLATPDLARDAQHRQAMAQVDAMPDALRLGRMLALMASGSLAGQTIHLTLNPEHVARLFDSPAAALAEEALIVTVPLSRPRRCIGARVIIGDLPRQPDPRLVAALTEAHRWARALKAGQDIAAIARNAKVSESHIRVRLQLAFLSPELQEAILDGSQPEGMTVQSLIRPELPLSWGEQRRRLEAPL